MNSKKRPPTDYRGMRQRHERWLLVLAIVILVVVGGGLIGLIFGWSQVLSALPCLLGGAGVIAGLYLLWSVLERWAES